MGGHGSGRRARLAILALVTAPALAAAASSERAPIVAKAIEHHGGDLYETTRTDFSLCSLSGCYEVESGVWRGWYSHRVRRATDDGERVVQATNDWLRWWEDGEPRPADAERERRLRDWVMERVYFAFLPYRLNDPSVRHQDLGPVSWAGRRLHRVKVTFEPGSSTDAQDEYMFWFDPESGRLELFAYSYDRGQGGLRFRRAINHRRVDGILFFDQENLGREGRGLSVDDIDPAYVERELRPISRVELREISVENLVGPPFHRDP